MFVRTDENLPKMPAYPADLASLGYERNEKGQVVSITFPPKFFTVHHTSSQEVNGVRKEAMHEVTRRLVIKDLAQEGVFEVFLGGEKGNEIMGIERKDDPAEKALPILATGLSELKQKKDVIVVIGESNQDLGVWAWRDLLGEGGFDGGSAVGLAKKLAKLGMDSTSVNPRDYKKLRDESKKKSAAKLSTTGTGTPNPSPKRQDPATEGKPTKTPGVIILNPGALLYSHKESRCMSAESWLNRERDHALSKPYTIDDVHNRIPGHKTPQEHIETCMDLVIPQLVNKDANLYVVGITNGAESFIDWFQDRQCTVGTPHRNHSDVPGTHNMINAIALMDSTHNTRTLHCRSVEQMLNVRGKSWIKSNKPLGKFLTAPVSTDPEVVQYLKETSWYAAAEEATEPLTSRSGNEIPAQGDEEDDGISPPSSGMATPAAGLSSTMTSFSLEENTQETPEGSSSSSSPAGPTTAFGLPLSADLCLVDEEAVADLSASFDHLTEIANCYTYSGSTQIDEMVWINAMDLALDHFQCVAERSARPMFFGFED